VAASRTRDPAGQAPPDAFETALRLLGQRSHGEVELRRKLARRSCPPEEIDRAMAQLRRLGYLDDGAFARALVARRSRERGPALIAAELAARGISRERAGEALAGLTAADQVAAARRLVTGPPIDPLRVARRLQRRGFTPEIIRAALELDAPEP
jgi:SOS response regulatory protein OraA/RecX